LRCSASERGGTSEFASRLIGQREVVHTTVSTTRRPGEWNASTSESEQLRTEAAVMASEIERLPDLTGFLKVASLPNWHIVALAARSDAPIRGNPMGQAPTPNLASISPQDAFGPQNRPVTSVERRPRTRNKRPSNSARQPQSGSKGEIDASSNSRQPQSPATQRSRTIDPR
jgi:hypothetical protein